jgi:hypothetical protein
MAHGPNGKEQSQSSQSSFRLSTVPFQFPSNDEFFKQFVSPGFDILTELSENRDAYKGGDVQLTIYKFPSSLVTILSQVSIRVPLVNNSNKPGLSITALCALNHGFNVIQSNSSIHNLLTIRERFDEVGAGAGTKDSWLVEGVSNIFQSFPLSVIDNPMGLPKSLNIHIGDGLKRAIFKFKQELGIEFSALATMCIMITLMDLDFILDERREEMKASIERFFRAVKVRTRIFEVLMSELER